MTSLGSDPQKQFFQGTAAEYAGLFSRRDSGANHSFQTRVRHAAALTQGLGGRFLDCACGSGEVTLAVLGSGSYSHATVADFSPAMIALAQRMVPESAAREMAWVEADCFAHLAACAPGSLDVIVCVGLIAHTGRLRELLGLLHRALAPEGRLLFQSTLCQHWGVALHRALTSERYRRQHGYLISYQSLREVRAAFAECGLREMAFRRYTLFLPFADKVLPRLNCAIERAAAPLASRCGSEGMWLLARR